MELGIKGRVALVTGGTRGIGRFIALKLAEEGAQVIVTSRSAEQIYEFLSAFHGKFAYDFVGIKNSLKLDDLNVLVGEVNKRNLAIDILVNNAGDTLGITNPLCDVKDWQAVMELNLTTPVELCRLLLPRMLNQDWGRIVNITSCAGLENSGPVTFSTAKAAITAYTRSMGRVLATMAQNVVMSAVFPGVVATKGGHWDEIIHNDPERAKKYLSERCPLGRFGLEEEVADTFLFYCSEKVSFSHGAIVPVDGGQSKHYMSHNYL